jgi:hypothetical protein
MRLKIRCDGWKRKYFGFAWEVNTPRKSVKNFLGWCPAQRKSKSALPTANSDTQAAPVMDVGTWHAAGHRPIWVLNAARTWPQQARPGIVSLSLKSGDCGCSCSSGRAPPRSNGGHRKACRCRSPAWGRAERTTRLLSSWPWVRGLV